MMSTAQAQKLKYVVELWQQNLINAQKIELRYFAEAAPNLSWNVKCGGKFGAAGSWRSKNNKEGFVFDRTPKTAGQSIIVTGFDSVSAHAY